MLFLACVDFSSASDRIVPWAIQLAGPTHEIVLLHVVPPDPDFVGYTVGPQSVRDSVAAHMRDRHRRLEEIGHGYGNVRPLCIQGPTAEKILDQALRLKADFIVLASHGHGTVHDLLVGSVARAVLRAAQVPVVVVPRNAQMPG
jgi:nucleotide-binding universal stress UspA family protein